MTRLNRHNTPPLRVSRPVSACSRCRAAKIKCDGKLPACSACERSNRAGECSSANDQFAKGKERSYVASLETRVEKLERRLAQAKQASSGTQQSISANSPEPRPTRPEMSATKTSRSKREEHSDIDSLVSDFGFLAVNATARDYHGFTSSMSFARLVLAGSSVQQIDTLRPKQLPPRHLALPMVQHYLENIFVFYPFFTETSLFGSVEALYHRGGQNATDWDTWIVNCVLAISAASLSRDSDDVYAQNASGYIAAAMTKINGVMHPGNLCGIQAILLLVQFSRLHPLFDSWYLVGMACRTMIDLGLHQDPPKPHKVSKQQLDLRRRIFFSTYSLDREISMVHRRAFSFSDGSVSVSLPSTPSATSDAGSTLASPLWLQPLDPAVHLWRLRVQQSQWYQELFQSSRAPYADPSARIRDYCRSMRSWFESTPSSTPPWVRQVFEAELIYSYIYILSPSDSRAVAVDDLDKARSLDFCISFAARTLPMVDDSMYTGPRSYDGALRVALVGRELLYRVRQGQERDILSVLSSQRSLARDWPDVPPLAGSAYSGTPNPNGATIDTARHAIQAIERIAEILDSFARRWDPVKFIYAQFVSDSAWVTAQLRRRIQRAVDQEASAAANAAAAVAATASATQNLMSDAVTAATAAAAAAAAAAATTQQDDEDLAAVLGADWDGLGTASLSSIPADQGTWQNTHV
ncbi:MAG: hypothetical protein M1825_003038 [Sarcosagium campestre]|nr:MAG: hypothetical protein M1825_003038 [Sarcosagium campestre]